MPSRISRPVGLAGASTLRSSDVTNELALDFPFGGGEVKPLLPDLNNLYPVEIITKPLTRIGLGTDINPIARPVHEPAAHNHKSSNNEHKCDLHNAPAKFLFGEGLIARLGKQVLDLINRFHSAA